MAGKFTRLIFFLGVNGNIHGMMNGWENPRTKWTLEVGKSTVNGGFSSATFASWQGIYIDNKLDNPQLKISSCETLDRNTGELLFYFVEGDVQSNTVVWR